MSMGSRLAIEAGGLSTWVKGHGGQIELHAWDPTQQICAAARGAVNFFLQAGGNSEEGAHFAEGYTKKFPANQSSYIRA